jgi:signal peptide peptidase SppA
MLNLRIFGHPWAVTFEVAEHGRRFIETEGFAHLRQIARVHAELDAARQRPGASAASAAGVAVIPVVGLMTQRGDIVDSMETASTAQLMDALSAAAADPSFKAIVLELDSPGGSVFGVAEAAAAIRDARKAKPVVAVANSMAGSAAFWLFSQAQEGFVTPSGEVGSVGVYGTHVDVSKEMEAKGRKVSYIYAGKYKVEGNPYEPLGDEARTSMQGDVDRYYDMFTKDVAKGRGAPVETVRNGFGQGRMLGARDAVAAGMADSVGTLDDAVRRAAALGEERRRSASSVAKAQGDFYRRQRG